MLRRPALLLWTRLTCFACVTAMLAITLSILARIDGWLVYETGPDVVIDIGVRVAIALMFGIAVGTVATLLSLPYVLRRPAIMKERSERIGRIACAIMILASSSAFLGGLLRWSMVVGLLNLTNRAYIFLWCFLSGLLFLGILVWYLAAPRRVIAINSLVDACSGLTTRRLLLFAGTGGLLSALIGMAPRTSRPPARAAKPKPGSPNILLVTFDALCAEDMSSYGYYLPTTPNIDSLAQSSFVFSNYYANSTFTTPSIVSMFTGRYPSSTHVYHYGGRLQGAATAKTLPNALRAAGYRTAASVANPGAHPDCLGFGDDFDFLPPPPIKDFATREAAAYFHSAVLAEDAGFVARFAPRVLEQLSPRSFGQTHSTFPPNLSFQQAKKMLDGLEDPFFLWIHVFAPHFPYLPESPYLKRFLKNDELRTHSDFADMVDLKGYNYSPSKQSIVDKARLRYNEWIAEADDAFGQFMTTFRSSGRLDKTAVIVSADHGESFQGGYVGHGGSRQLRPILHVPLTVHLPGQILGRQITTVADQTTLAPTILEIAKIARPDWMDGQSLCDHMRAEGSTQTGRAFTQCLESNSVFKPIERGTIGVLDGQHQYVLDLETKTGALYNLDEAHEQKIDRSCIEANVAANLRDEIGRRFPDLLGETT
jgi:arylsulfatase A-like enzyme